MVVVISLTKLPEGKEREQIKGKTNTRRPIFNPTIQVVIVNVYTKFEVSILNGFGDIFNEKIWKKKNKQNE